MRKSQVGCNLVFFSNNEEVLCPLLHFWTDSFIFTRWRGNFALLNKFFDLYKVERHFWISSFILTRWRGTFALLDKFFQLYKVERHFWTNSLQGGEVERHLAAGRERRSTTKPSRRTLRIPTVSELGRENTFLFVFCMNVCDCVLVIICIPFCFCVCTCSRRCNQNKYFCLCLYLWFCFYLYWCFRLYLICVCTCARSCDPSRSDQEQALGFGNDRRSSSTRNTGPSCIGLRL